MRSIYMRRPSSPPTLSPRASPSAPGARCRRRVDPRSLLGNLQAGYKLADKSDDNRCRKLELVTAESARPRPDAAPRRAIEKSS
ncbi:hypothetical protein J6590_015110 [Homalodisca vitripennis]|nr:hypothetical protein J6590_015110 [Homalodisca vitripennis]